MPKRYLLGALVVVVLGAGAAIVMSMTSPKPKTLDDYCGPPEQVLDVPATSDEGVVASPGYTHVATMDGALGASKAPDGRLFVATKGGVLWQVPAAGGAPANVLDLTGQLGTGTEQGLLGVAADPDGTHVYVYATFSDGTARLVEYALTEDGVDEASARDVLNITDPHPSHNGGQLAFDGERALVLGIGDGGNGDVTGAAQDVGSLFGKLLRIDPHQSEDEAYTIPPDNPTVDRAGARPEILAYGFRNPWGWTIDPQTKDLWVGDVGQLCQEEISMAADRGNGENFGWPFVEGAHEFRGPVLGPNGEPDDATPVVDLGERPAVVAPVLEYPHGDGACGVIGGPVYRGTAVPELVGTYLWTDLCERGIRTLRREGDTWVTGRLGGTIPGGIASFAQTPDGEVYLLSLNDGVYEITAP